MAWTPEQLTGIAATWNDPNISIAEKQRQMTEFGVNVDDIAQATGKDRSIIGNTLVAGGAQRGFGGYSQGITDTYSGVDNFQPTPTPTPSQTTVGGGLLGQAQTVVGPVSPTPTTTTTQTPTTGILNTAGTSTYTPGALGDPAKWTITPDQTVAGQMNTLTDANNPFTQQARTRAQQTANQRGLLNTSMALTAADSAAYDAALPIAQADAANASKVAGYNTDQLYQTGVKNFDAQNQAGIANASQANQMAQANLSAQTQKYINDQNTQTQMAIKTMDTAAQQHLAEVENASKALIQSSSVASNAFSTYQQTLYNNSVNTNMDANARYLANESAFNVYQQQLHMAALLTGTPDVSSLLTFTEINPNKTSGGGSTTVGAPALPLTPGTYSPGYESLGNSPA